MLRWTPCLLAYDPEGIYRVTVTDLRGSNHVFEMSDDDVFIPSTSNLKAGAKSVRAYVRCFLQMVVGHAAVVTLVGYDGKGVNLGIAAKYIYEEPPQQTATVCILRTITHEKSTLRRYEAVQGSHP